MWPVNLSVRLPIAGLVSHYLTNYLIGRELILQRISPLVSQGCPYDTLCGISVRFQTLSPSKGQIAHALLTRPPLNYVQHPILGLPRVPGVGHNSVRLACVRRAASVRPEPGSNSPIYCS
jgi:hypothetical protein